MMKLNNWTLGLIGAGLVSVPAICQADESTNLVLSALSATTLSGYVDTSAQWNVGTGNANVPGYAFSSGKADGFNFNVGKIALEHPVNPSDAWGAGYKAELIFGPDANVGTGLGTSSTGISGDFAVKQAYVALHAPVGNGLDFKVGVWDTIMGYEVFDSPSDPNFTRSYGFTIEPLTHTGVQATYQVTGDLSATLAVADTFGPKINERAFPARAESYKSYMVSATYTAPTNWGFLAGSTLSGCVMNGFNSTVSGGVDETSYYVGATLNTPLAGLKVGASYDYLGVSHQPLSASSEYANAVALYASFQATEKLTLLARGEYASTDIPTIFTSTSDGRREVMALTGTLQYDLWKNVLSRLECRWDHAGAGGPAYGGMTSDDSPSKRNSFIVIADVAYKF
jgi:Putative beta-barrel porin-2, OmpL-like. bbp2